MFHRLFHRLFICCCVNAIDDAAGDDPAEVEEEDLRFTGSVDSVGARFCAIQYHAKKKTE